MWKGAGIPPSGAKGTARIQCHWREIVSTYNREFAEVVLMLNPPGPLADLANAIAFLADKCGCKSCELEAFETSCRATASGKATGELARRIR